MLHAIVMAGGAGTRFWPASRKQTPKQLLHLAGDRAMITATVDRLGDLVSADHTLVVTNEVLVAPIREKLPKLPPANIIGEPCKRDTAPCIGLAALWVSRDDPDAVMVVLPADHVIATDAQFQSAVTQAVSLVEAYPNRIVTFGIPPAYPAEIYGYIHRSDPLADIGSGDSPAFAVQQFKEKPSAEVAEEYLATGEYYWNSGIFVWRAATIIAALEQHQPKMLAHLKTIAAAIGTDEFDAVFAKEFAAIEGTSIDYAVMEHHDDVAVIEAPFDWDDVGNWPSLERLRDQDEAGNTIAAAKHLGIDTTGTVVYDATGHLVVTVGLDDCIVVHTPDATLVARKDQEEKLRNVVKQLADLGWEEFL